MRASATRRVMWACSVLLSLGLPTLTAEEIAGGKAERRAVAAALELVPAPLRRPIVVIDPEGTADPIAIRPLDAFVVKETDGRLREKIYINRESLILREAVRSVDFYVKMLAALIVHEAAHLDGQPEAEARAAEIAFIGDLVERRAVRQQDATRYLALLQATMRRDGHDTWRR